MLRELRTESQSSLTAAVGFGPESVKGHAVLSWSIAAVGEEWLERMLTLGRGLQLFCSYCVP